ncbi:hypothetical protein NDU88_004537 [Pleurodeles waltl]|uniref:Uncharacterized protein n=1 Tax=Pleurodeles waltl TaxID=8319 RepID=A0AAV7NJV2_PLEWA|nr:hypothetical protein NDU88_004537 [Pleurodeles waltl]
MAAPSGASIFLNIGEGRQHVCGGEDRAPLLANDTVVVIDSDEDLEIGLDIEEEPLDYEEEDPVHGVQSVAVEKSKTSRQAVQRNRLSCRPQDLAGNLLRDRDSLPYNEKTFTPLDPITDNKYEFSKNCLNKRTSFTSSEKNMLFVTSVSNLCHTEPTCFMSLEEINHRLGHFEKIETA